MHEAKPSQIELAEALLKETKLNRKQQEYFDSEVEAFYDASNYQTVEVTYYGEPKAQARARTGASGFFYDPSKGLKKWVLDQVMSCLPKDFIPIETGVNIELDFFRQTPKGFSQADKLLAELGIKQCTTKPDVDNFVKLVQDALNKTLYKDDSAIVLVFARKFYSCRPRVEMRITYRK